jgi:hypothetical protein
LELKLPDEAMRVTCPYCASLLDATQGKLQFLAELKKRTTEIPVGAKGNFDGVDYQIIGWLERTCTVEGIDYTWDEYLLYDEKSAGYRFLVNSAGHRHHPRPVPAGEVSEGSRGPLWKGTLFRRFASVQASVTGVKGEFYWAVALGESVTANDYVAPPQALSEERSEDEVNWSHAIYLTPEQVRAALKLPAALAAPRGVGMMQPNPWGESLGSMLRWLTVGSIAAIALYVALAARPSPVVFDQAFTPAVVPAPAGAPAAAEPGGEVPEPPPNQDVALDPARPENGTWRLSAPFRIEGARKNLEIDLESGVDNTWAGVAGALVNQATSEVTEFNLETSYYHGYEDGESWSEGSHSESAFISAVPPGEYVMRLESIWEPGKPAPQLHVKLTSGVARLLHLFLALLALGLLPALAIWRNGAFEKARWEESNID